MSARPHVYAVSRDNGITSEVRLFWPEGTDPRQIIDAFEARVVETYSLLAQHFAALAARELEDLSDGPPTPVEILRTADGEIL